MPDTGPYPPPPPCSECGGPFHEPGSIVRRHRPDCSREAFIPWDGQDQAIGEVHRLRKFWLEDDEPQLGLATTRQMLEELVARFEIATLDDAVRMSLQHWLNQLPDDVLDYRTVDELPSEYR